MGMFFGCRMSWMLSCWEAGQPTSARRLQSNTAEQGRRTDKREVQRGLFPPGFSSRAWQRSEAASLILPPGQSLASSPDGGEQGGERRDQEEIDDWFLTTHPVAESHSPPHPPVMCQAWPRRPDAPVTWCFRKVLSCLLVTGRDAVVVKSIQERLREVTWSHSTK